MLRGEMRIAIGTVLRSFHEKAVFVNADVAAVF